MDSRLRGNDTGREGGNDIGGESGDDGKEGVNKGGAAKNMFKYVSLLRGVNVGGHNKVAMRELRVVYEQAGCAAVETYLQSGNVVFTSPEKDKAVLTKKIEHAVAKRFGVKIPVLLKTKKEWRAIIAKNPYAEQIGIDRTQLHVALPFAGMAKSSVEKIEESAAAPDEFCVANDVIYLYCPNGYRQTKLTNNRLEKVLAVPVTTRNFRTVWALGDMMN